jgi:hypothetical protein
LTKSIEAAYLNEQKFPFPGSCHYFAFGPESFQMFQPAQITNLSEACIYMLRRFVVVCALTTLTTSSEVHAACGDYLFRNGVPVHQSAASHMFSGPELAIGLLARNDSSSPAKPCHGPNCSAPTTPLAIPLAAPFHLSHPSDPVAILDALATLQGQKLGRWIPESDRGEHFEATTIFRPPAFSV